MFIVKTLGVAAAAAWLSVVATAQTSGGSQATGSSAAQNVTVTGCIAAGPNNTFTLTGPAPASEPPLGTTATTPAGDKVAKTITYTLTGGKADELQPHVGHTVQVTGAESAPQASAQVNEKSSGSTGTSGSRVSGAAPKVETTAQAQIVTLSVGSIKMVASSCELLKK